MNQYAGLISEAYQAFVFVAAALLPPLHRLTGKNRQHQIQLNYQRIDDIDKERTDHRHHQKRHVRRAKAFFIDIVNALVIKLYLMLPIFAG